MDQLKSFKDKHLLQRIATAFGGIFTVFKEEKNFRIQFVAAIFVIFLMIFLQLNAIESSILVLTILTVLALELINSQIEKFLDLIQPELHVKVKRIKDFSAGAVLISVIGSVIIGVLIFLPHILNFLSHYK
jgi:diacylglycerol kinase